MKEILKGMDGQGAFRRLREEAELVLRRFATVARLPIESCTEAERAAEMYGISQDTAEVLARIAQIATCTLEELGECPELFPGFPGCCYIQHRRRAGGAIGGRKGVGAGKGRRQTAPCTTEAAADH